MKGIGVENFRIFKDPVHFEFPGITALIGPNSSGKSSLLKLLKLLKANIGQDKKVPTELNFRGSDHFLGNFRYALNRESGNKKDFVISFEYDLFTTFKETTKKVEVSFHYVEDVRKKELSNSILNKIIAKTGSTVILELDMQLDKRPFEVLRNEVRPILNFEWLLATYHEFLDINLLDLSRVDNYGQDLFDKSKSHAVKTGYRTYIDKLRISKGYVDSIELSDPLNKERCKEVFGLIDAMGTYGGSNTVARLYSKDNMRLFELLAKKKKKEITENESTELEQNVWPSYKSSTYQKTGFMPKRLTFFTYPVLEIILNNYEEYEKKKKSKDKCSYIEVQLTDLNLDDKTRSLELEFFKESVVDQTNIIDIVACFRERDAKVLHFFDTSFNLFSEYYVMDIQKLIENNEVWDNDNDLKSAVSEQLIKTGGTESKNLALAKNASDSLNSLIRAFQLRFEFMMNWQWDFEDEINDQLSSYILINKNFIEKFIDQRKESQFKDYQLKDAIKYSNIIQEFKKVVKNDIDQFYASMVQPVLQTVQTLDTIDFISLGSIRGTADRVYSDQDQSTDWRKMIFLLSTIPEDRLQFVNKWIREFDIANSLDIERGSDAASSIVRLIHDNYKENLSDLGFGISQILPIICQIALAPEKSNIIVEEPEANLHPAYQSKLADLFCDALKTFKHKFILETHSEYLIRKLQVVIAKGDLDHDKANVYYFNPSGSSEPVRVKHISIRKDGCLSSPFGEGFYDEASNWRYELLRINKEQNN